MSAMKPTELFRVLSQDLNDLELINELRAEIKSHCDLLCKSGRMPPHEHVGMHISAYFLNDACDLAPRVNAQARRELVGAMDAFLHTLVTIEHHLNITNPRPTVS